MTITINFLSQIIGSVLSLLTSWTPSSISISSAAWGRGRLAAWGRGRWDYTVIIGYLKMRVQTSESNARPHYIRQDRNEAVLRKDLLHYRPNFFFLIKKSTWKTRLPLTCKTIILWRPASSQWCFKIDSAKVYQRLINTFGNCLSKECNPSNEISSIV